MWIEIVFILQDMQKCLEIGDLDDAQLSFAFLHIISLLIVALISAQITTRLSEIVLSTSSKSWWVRIALETLTFEILNVFLER